MLRTVLAVFLLLLQAACVTGATNAAAQTAGAPPATSSASPATGYRLGVDDKVSLVVFGEQELTRDYQVGPDGMIEVPLIGRIQAAGRSIDELSEAVRAKLADGYIRNPSVSASIISFRPFFILGEVNKPGEYPYRDGLTVSAAVATAQGFTYRAQKRYVYIKRQNATEEMRVPLTPDLVVQPGDTLRIGERYF